MSTQPNEASTITYYPNFQALAAAMAPDTPRPRLRPATDFPVQEVDWLWPGKIPIGKVTLLIGDPGCGKSLIALDAAARVTRGSTFPANQPPALPGVSSPASTCSTDESARPGVSSLNETDPRQSRGLPAEHAPGSVLILSAEDQIADTIRPRLDAAGADPAKVFFASDITDLRLDLGKLAMALEDAPDCRLIIVDPVTAYVGPSDSHYHTIVRKVLAPLAELAAARKIAILAVTHLRKNSGAAITRATGSMGFAAAARCVWTVVTDDDNPNRNLLLPVKNNLGPRAPGLAFSIEVADGSRAPSVRWLADPVDASSQETSTKKRGPEAEDRRNAAKWLELALADGPRECWEVLAEGKQNGFHERTLQRALHLVGGMTRKLDFGGGWLWSLTHSNGAERPTNGVGGVSDADDATKKPGVFDETCRLRKNPDEPPIENLSPSRIPPTICEPPPISVAESTRYLDNLDKHRKPPDPIDDDDPNSPTGHPLLDQLLANFRNSFSSPNPPHSTLNSQPSPNPQPRTKKSARSHSRFPTGTDSWHFTRPAESCDPGAMHPGGVSAQAPDVSSTRRREDAI